MLSANIDTKTETKELLHQELERYGTKFPQELNDKIIQMAEFMRNATALALEVKEMATKYNVDPTVLKNVVSSVCLAKNISKRHTYRLLAMLDNEETKRTRTIQIAKPIRELQPSQQQESENDDAIQEPKPVVEIGKGSYEVIEDEYTDVDGIKVRNDYIRNNNAVQLQQLESNPAQEKETITKEIGVEPITFDQLTENELKNIHASRLFFYYKEISNDQDLVNMLTVLQNNCISWLETITKQDKLIQELSKNKKLESYSLKKMLHLPHKDVPIIIDCIPSKKEAEAYLDEEALRRGKK